MTLRKFYRTTPFHDGKSASGTFEKIQSPKEREDRLPVTQFE